MKLDSASVRPTLRITCGRCRRLFGEDDLGREHATTLGSINGVPAAGGSLDGPGPVIAAGMLFVNLGYGQFASTPGNVLLAFSVDGH